MPMKDPDRVKAWNLYKESNGSMTNRDIAAKVGRSRARISKWKRTDKWEEKVPPGPNKIGKSGKKHGGQPGNPGNPDPPCKLPKGNTISQRHGFLRKVIPDDPEVQEILKDLEQKSTLDMLYESIVFQYVAIIRAQKIMYVQSKEDLTKLMRREKYSQSGEEIEYEIQFAWDKQNNFLQAQSKAFNTLEILIRRYESMVPDGPQMQEQLLKIEKLKAEIDNIKNPESDDNEQWIASLKAVANKRKQAKDDNDGS